MKNKPEPLKIAHFRFALIAPVIQGLYPDASEAAYYRRVTQDPILRPDGVSYKYSPDTLVNGDRHQPNYLLFQAAFPDSLILKKIL